MYLSDVFTVTANLAGIPGSRCPSAHSKASRSAGRSWLPWWRGADTAVAVGAVLESTVGKGAS
jgi:Asp-tRNA(Asn)/Glu-tRNA(Gln) amidotransferase A subunit family amidase